MLTFEEEMQEEQLAKAQAEAIENKFNTVRARLTCYYPAVAEAISHRQDDAEYDYYHGTYSTEEYSNVLKDLTVEMAAMICTVGGSLE